MLQGKVTSIIAPSGNATTVILLESKKTRGTEAEIKCEEIPYSTATAET